MTRSDRLLISALILLVGALPALAQGEAPADQVVLPRLDPAPVIDGDLSDAAWAGAPIMDGWTIPLTTQAAPKAAAARVGFDDAGIYVGVRFSEPDPASLQTIAPDGGSGVWKDDALEVWIRTTDDPAARDQFIVNAAGARQRVRSRAGGSEGPQPEFPAATSVGEDHWIVEMFISYTEIGMEGVPEPGQMIQLKLGREDPEGRMTTLSVWPPRAPYGAAEGYGRAYFLTSNLLTNASFAEINDAGQPAGWGLSEGTAERIAIVEDNGRQALRWETPGSYATLQRSIRLEPNSLYRLEGWTRGDAGIYLRARTRRTADQEASEMYSVNTEPSDDYRYWSVTFPTGEQGSALIIIGTTESLGAGTVHLADLAVSREASIATSGPAIPLTPGETQRITDIPVTDSRAMRGFVGAPVDGRLDSVAWNGSTWEYGSRSAGAGVYYSFANNNGLHITLGDEDGVDAVQIRGGAKVMLYRDASSYYEPGSGELLWEWQANASSSRALFGERVMSDYFSFFDLRDGFISDVYFLRLGEDDPLPEPLVRNAQQTTDLPEELADAAVQFGSEPGAVHRLAATEMAVQIAMDEDDWVHFVTEPVTQQTGLVAVGLRLDMPDASAGLPLEVAVMDPFNPAQRVINTELVAEGPGVAHVVLDHLDQIVPAGRPIWVAVKTGAAVTLNTPQVELYQAPVEQALPEAVDYRLWIVRTMFAALSEPRPWMSLRSRDTDLDEWQQTAYAGEKIRELIEELAFAVELAPDHPLVRQYDQWVWQNAGLPPYEPTIDVVPGAPEWAVLLRQAWLEARDVPKWWAENRLVPTGEFGGLVGDDTDMYQNYVMFPMISDDEVSELLMQGAAALAELAEEKNMEEGLNKHSTDPLHAYEEGVNHEAIMTWLGYGDPVYFERSLAAARSMPALTVVTDRGHRHFKNQTLGSEDLRIDREPGEAGGAHPLMLHPLFEVLWYNGHPQVEQFLREWADGWLEHQQPGAYPTLIDVKTEEPTGRVYTDRPLYGYGLASNFFSMIAYAGDEKYARPFMDMFGEGRATLRINQFLPEFYQHGLLDELDEATLRALEEAEPYLPVLTRGDRAPLMAALREDIAHMQRFKYMYTEAEQFTDRIFLYAVQNAAKAYTGTYTTRNKMSHGHAVSWEGFGTDFAALVLEARDDRLKVAVYSFADEPMEGAMRAWRLNNGRYRVAMGPDADDDGEFDAPVMDAPQMELQRYSRVPITLQPGQVTLIEIEQIEELEPIVGRADLALSPIDTEVVEGEVLGVLHNIGQEGAAVVQISLIDPQGNVVSTQSLADVPGIGNELEPVRLPYTLTGAPADASGWRVVVDPGQHVEEIYEGNNEVVL